MIDRRAESRAAGAPAAQSGAGDVALFGALPIAFVTAPATANAGVMSIARAPANDAGEANVLATESAGAPALPEQGAAHGAIAGLLAPASASYVLQGPVAAIEAPAAAASPDQAVAPVAGSHVATFVPSVTAHGIGDAIAAQDSPSVAAPATGLAVPVSPAPQTIGVEDAITSMRATAASLHDAISALADRLQTGKAPAGGEATSAIKADLDHIQQQTGTLVGHAGEIGGAAVAGIARVADHASELAGHAGTALDSVSGLVADAAGHADLLLAGIADTLGSVTGVAAQAMATSGHFDHVGGSDPAGGIATLVGMIAAADTFDLHDSGVADDLTPALGMLGAADLLAELTPSDALLGVHLPQDNILSGVTEHLHDGLFGHG